MPIFEMHLFWVLFTGNISIGTYRGFETPIYFELPLKFSGDHITSYGGYLNFAIVTQSCQTVFNTTTLQRYPLIQVHSHENLIIDYFGIEIYNTSPIVSQTIQLKETNWRLHSDGQLLSRALMMAALQNVKSIFIRGTSWVDITQVTYVYRSFFTQ